MAENSDKIIFVTAGGNGNGDVRTEIRQETGGAKRKITATPKEGQKPRTNQLSDAKIRENPRSRNSGKVNIEKFNKASSDFDEIQVTVGNSGKGHERPRKITRKQETHRNDFKFQF